MDVTAIAFYIVNEVAADMEYDFYSNLFLIWIWGEEDLMLFNCELISDMMITEWKITWMYQFVV